MVRYRVKVTRAGTIYIALTLALGIAAVNTGSSLLYLILSVMLSAMALSGLSSLVNLLGIKVRARPAGEVFAGMKASFLMEIENRKPFPAFLIAIEGGEGRATVPYLPPWGRSQVFLPLLFPRRGWQRVPPLRIVSSHPFGLFRRGFWMRTGDRCLVYPRPIPAPEPLPSSEPKGERRGGERGKGPEGDFFGVRPFSPGDSFRLVHWQATARVAHFMVKEYREEERGPFLLHLDEGLDLEFALGKLTFLASRLLQKGYAVGVELPHLFIPPSWGEGQRRRILEALALYE